MHEQKIAIALHHPNVDGPALERLADLRPDQGNELIHLDGRAEDFLDVVEVGEAGDRGEGVVALEFVLPGGSQRGTGDLGHAVQDVEVCFRQRFIEAENFNGADQGAVAHQWKIGEGVQGFADIEMSILLADEAPASEQERFAASGKDA